MKNTSSLPSFLCFIFLLSPEFCRCLSPDGLALLSLKSAVDPSSPSSAVFSDWSSDDATPCGWTGITCANVSDSDGLRVVAVAIAGKNLRGYIPSELGSLLYLRRLNLHDNDFRGSIPEQLFNATSLHGIFLYGNNLSGSLPPSICQLPRLQNLDLSNNSLSGQIPAGLKNCLQLQRLVLARNKFSGEFPSGVFPEMPNLVQLDLSSNQLNGSVPADLGELKSLAGTLNLSFNRFSGEIPESLGDLPVTVSFDLRNNHLSGEIPQTGAFANQGPTAFLNNPSLCGFPLKKPCRNPPQVSPAAGQSPLPASDSRSRKGLSPGLIVLISIADAAGVTLIGLVIVYLYWKKKDSSGCSCTGTSKLGGSEGGGCVACLPGCSNESEGGSERVGGPGEGELVAIDKGFTFELDELLRASAYVLGKSGLGIVYKVVLGNGIPVAVRRLGEGGDPQRYRDFAAEIQAISRVKHPNIVRLRAYYWASDEKLLITDFISNGNLASALRGKNGQPLPSLKWSTRLRIAKGTARGLAYIHECSPKKMVHGDIKPSNILLDANFQPHISDFGLSRLVAITGADQSSSSSSTGLIGGAFPHLKPSHPNNRTNQHCPPEARTATAAAARPTQKWDVYSFGIVLLELLTGRSSEAPSSPTTSSSSAAASGGLEGPDLARQVRKGFDENKPVSEMADPMVLQEAHAKKEVATAFQVALACTEADPEIRPRMKTVSENLDRIGS